MVQIARTWGAPSLILIAMQHSIAKHHAILSLDQGGGGFSVDICPWLVSQLIFQSIISIHKWYGFIHIVSHCLMARCCALCFKTAPPFWFKVMTADCRLCTGCPRWMHDKTWWCLISPWYNHVWHVNLRENTLVAPLFLAVLRINRRLRNNAFLISGSAEALPVLLCSLDGSFSALLL